MHTSEPLTPCDMCGGSAFRTRFVASDLRTGTGTGHVVATCRSCGLTQLNPRPSAETLAAAYPDWLWRDEIARGRTMPSRVAHALDLLSRRYPRPGTLLDVGCGPGAFLEGAVARGWRARGIEASQSQVDYCVARGLDAAYVADFPGMPDDGQRFDVVTFNHVLEHVPAPLAYLRRAFALVKRSGCVLIAVPNFDSISATVFGHYWMHLDAPRHLFQFTPRTLGRCVRAAGGTLVAVRAGDREDNATGARESLRRWVTYGLLRRPPAAVRVAASEAAGGAVSTAGDSPASLSLPKRMYRAYGNVMARFSERVGLADTIIAVAEVQDDGEP